MTTASPTPAGHDQLQNRTRQQRADAAFNQLNPGFELAVDQGVPGWQQAVQQWEAYRSLGGRVDNHLRIDNTGPAWSRHMVVVWRTYDALLRGARQQAEETFTRLNPDFGVLPDGLDAAQHTFAQQREHALALGVRATVAVLDENHPGRQQRQAAITGRVPTPAHRDRSGRRRQARADRQQPAHRPADHSHHRSPGRRPIAEREEERSR